MPPITRNTAIPVIFLVLTLLLLPVGKAQATSLDKVIAGQVPGLEANARGMGMYFGECINLNFDNTTGQTQHVEVPLGLLLVPESLDVQTMVCAGGENLKVPPGKSSKAITAFCGERHDQGPPENHVMTPGGIAPKELLKELKEIQRTQDFSHSSQQRIWNIADNFNLSEGNKGPISEGKSAATVLISLITLLTWLIANNAANITPGAGAAGEPPGGRHSSDHADRPSWSLMHRKSYDDLYDEKNERWVARDSNAGKAVQQQKREEMEEKGYNYDGRADAYVHEGMEYDPDGDYFRHDIEPARQFEIDPEQGDASRPDPGGGWLFPGDPGTDAEWSWQDRKWLVVPGRSARYESVHKKLEDRYKYLEKVEDDVKQEHRRAAEQEKEAEQKKDKWLAGKWRTRRQEILKTMKKVQQQKLDLSNRVNQRDMAEKTYIERQKKKWTAGKVAGEMKDIFIPNPQHLEPIFRRTLDLRNRLQDSINRQDGLFRQVDGTIEQIKEAVEKAREAKAAGKLKTARQWLDRVADGRRNLDQLNQRMQDIHKRNIQWQAGSHVLTGTGMMTGVQYHGQSRTLYQIGKSGVQFLKPTMGIHRPSMINEDGEIVGTPEKPKPGPSVADGSAASPEDMSRQQNYEFFGVDKNGNVRSIRGTGNVDMNPRKGEVIVIRDKNTGALSKHKFFGEGAKQKSLHQGQKDLLWKKAQDALGGKDTGAGGAGGAGGDSSGGPGGGGGGSGQGKPSLSDMVKKNPNAAQQASARAEQKAPLLKRGETPQYSGKEYPTKKGWPAEFEDGQPWPKEAKTFQPDDEWFPRDSQGNKLRSVKPEQLPKDFPKEAARWREWDKAMGVSRDGTAANQGEHLGLVRNQQAKDLASRFPKFDQLDKAIRQAYKDSGIFADDVVNPEPGQRFIELMDKRGITPQKFQSWQKAMDEGWWAPEKNVRPPTDRITPSSGGGGGTGVLPPGSAPPEFASLDGDPGVPPSGQPPAPPAPPAEVVLPDQVGPPAPAPSFSSGSLFGQRPDSFAGRALTIGPETEGAGQSTDGVGDIPDRPTFERPEHQRSESDLIRDFFDRESLIDDHRQGDSPGGDQLRLEERKSFFRRLEDYLSERKKNRD